MWHSYPYTALDASRRHQVCTSQLYLPPVTPRVGGRYKPSGRSPPLHPCGRVLTALPGAVTPCTSRWDRSSAALKLP